MTFFYTSVMVLILIFIVKKYKDIFHPICINGLIWLIFPLFYEILCVFYSNMEFLSDKFFVYILSYFIIFTIFCEIAINGKRREKKNALISVAVLDSNKKRLLQNTKHLKHLMQLECFLNILLILEIFRTVNTWNYSQAMVMFRYYQVFEPQKFSLILRLLRYTFSLTAPTICYVYLFHPKHKKIYSTVLILQCCIILPIYGSKGFIMKFFLLFFFMLYFNGKINPSSLIILFITGVVGIYFMTMVRDASFMSDYTYLDYIFVYALTPFKAFDGMINGLVPFPDRPIGSRSWGFFYRVASRLFGFALPPAEERYWVNIPAPSGQDVPTNVFTGLGNHYMDFGLIGIMMYGALFGIVLGLLYRGFAAKRDNPIKMVYILISYCIVFQFFGDELFGFMSMPLQDLIASFIVFKRLRIHEIFKYNGIHTDIIKDAQIC